MRGDNVDRISDEELQNFTSLFNKIMEEGGVKRPDKLWSILQELKERREADDKKLSIIEQACLMQDRCKELLEILTKE